MTRIGVLSNPHSRRNLRIMSRIRAAVSRHPEVLHAELEKITDIAAILEDFARRDVKLIVINGGDGTVHATLTELLNGSVHDCLPELAILSGGMTNLIARDVGFGGSPERALARLLASRGADTTRITRPVLSMSYAADRPPVHGMFFGTAAFYRAMVFSHRRVHPLGFEQSAAAGLTLGLVLLRALFRRDGNDRIIHGDMAALAVDGQPERARCYFLILATTLDRTLLGLRPFWGEGRGDLRFTAIEFPPKRLWASMFPVLFGRPLGWMAESGYRSGLAQRIEIALDCPVVLDGEVYHPQRDRPVVLTADRQAVFLRD